MSIEHMAAVLHHSRAKGTAKLVLLGIANHEGDGGAWPAVSTLATYANVHPRKVQEALRVLVNLGELVVHQQKGGPAGLSEYLKPNLYSVAVRCPSDCDGTPQHRTRQVRLAYPVPNTAPGAGIGTPSGADSGRGTGADSGTLTTQRTNQGRTTNSSTETNHRELPNHVDKPCGCHQGWLGESEDGRRIPCLVCKPHLRRVIG